MNKKVKNLALPLFISLTASIGYCGNVVDTIFKTQALLYQNNGSVDGCGIRFVGIQDISGRNLPVKVIDGSFTIFSQGLALTKLGMSVTNSNSVMQGNTTATQIKIKNYWMRRVGGKITKPVNGKSSASTDTKGFLLQEISADDFIDIISAVNSQSEFQVGVSSANDKSEWIFSGLLSANEKDSQRLSDCLKSLSDSK